MLNVNCALVMTEVMLQPIPNHEPLVYQAIEVMDALDLYRIYIGFQATQMVTLKRPNCVKTGYQSIHM